jgi:hypothetical protein
MFLPKSDQGLFQPLGATRHSLPRGWNRKRFVQGEGKQPQVDPVLERALSHPKRLEILGYLRQKKRAGTDEAELIEVLDLSAPRVKYHLSVLYSAGPIAPVENQAPGAIDRYIAATSAGL